MIPSQPAPTAIQDGLALYAAGQGDPLLLMPYPHGFMVTPMVAGPLSASLQELGFRVISFDPPGMFRTTREARITMDEMLACALETLEFFDVQGAVKLLGHSMGGMCALAFTLEQPQQVESLALFSSLSGGPAITRNRGVPLSLSWTGADFWRLLTWGARLMYGGGSLALHKKMLNLLYRNSYADHHQVPQVEIHPGDSRQPAPRRDRWPAAALRIDYRARLGEVRVPTLVGVGRHDPQTPVACSEELAGGIPGARLVVFENSSHNLFEEEPGRFKRTLTEFGWGSVS